ncbi:MAG TPA: GNAT family N-acetyltransferase [Candidatus Acidoferrales bacterium]|nr:GNAT family N-acetyltransferase [Candidatus Acidoferrales bacterium]
MNLRFEMVLPEEKQFVEDAKQLFAEYAKSLNFSLCFQGFDKELRGLPGEYAPPSGRLFLAFLENKLAGCVALRKIDDSVCEMKRLYLRPDFRGKGIGKKMTIEVVKAARDIGYSRMRLDTVPEMKEAISLYRLLGFVEISPYRENPIPGAIFMELIL